LTSLLITRDFARQVIKSRCQGTDSEFDPQSNSEVPALNPVRDAALHDFAAVDQACLKRRQERFAPPCNTMIINGFFGPTDGTQVACDAVVKKYIEPALAMK